MIERRPEMARRSKTSTQSITAIEAADVHMIDVLS